MTGNVIELAVAIGKKTGRRFLTTASREGIPHLTIAKKIDAIDTDRIAVAGRFSLVWASSFFLRVARDSGFKKSG